MSLPFVTSLTRERITRDLDDRGPDSCLVKTVHELTASNPEVLDMASKCVAAFGEGSRKILLELCIFYRLLVAEFETMDPALRLPSPFPRVPGETRDGIIEQISMRGAEDFTVSSIAELERSNAELVQIAHNAVERHGSYVLMMQGVALL